MASSDPIFVDASGNHYLVRDVAGAGDCALLALLMSPSFEAPVSGADELRRAIVAFARGEARDDCSNVFSLVGEKNNDTFDGYLSQVIQKGFWVGTIVFIWTSMAYGINIVSHFFNEMKQPASNSTVHFLQLHLPNHVENINPNKTVHVFFHQYKNMARCRPSMYNHFATLVPLVTSYAADKPTLNSSVDSADKPWWTQVSATTSLKGRGGKSQLNKDERKQHYEALTFEYLKNSDKGIRLASEMSAKLEKAKEKEEALAASLSIPVEDLDVGVTSPDLMEETCHERMTKDRVLTSSYERRNWLQRAKVIFIHLHPKIGGKVPADTAALTGVNEHTLLGWLVQKKMISVWLDLVDSMTAEIALKSLPLPLQDLFSHIDPESKVCVQRFKNRLQRNTGDKEQVKILFKGGKVSSRMYMS